MSDTTINFAKSKEQVAYDITAKILGSGTWSRMDKAAILDLYTECLEATSGKRNKEAGLIATIV